MGKKFAQRLPDGVTRRQLLASGVAVSSAFFAGCTGDDGGDEGGDDGSNNGGDDGTSGDDGSGNGGDDGSDTDEPDEGDRDRFMDLQITQQVEPAHDYDPVVSNDVYSFRIVSHLFDGLYEYGPGLGIEPKLAAGEPEVSDNGTTIVVELKDGPEFANGDPVTAEDVVHSFVAPVEEETDNLTSFDMIEEATAIDEQTVEFDLGEDPYGPFTTVTLATSIVNKSVREEDKEAYNAEPVGSGPYRLVDWVEGDFADIELREDYWDADNTDAFINEARWVSAEDDAARVSRIRAGDTDIIQGVPADDFSVLEDESGVNVLSDASISYFYAAFNCNEGPTTDPDVRRGVEKAFSMDQFVRETVEPAGTSIASPIPDDVGEPWEFPVDRWAGMTEEYDPEGAADLLSGHDGWEPRIIVPPDDIREQLGELIAGRLREVEGVSIDPSVQRLDWGPFLEQFATGNADDYAMYTLGWAGAPDPDLFIFPLFHESSAGVNQGHYYDRAEFHDMIEEARNIADFDRRRELYINVVDEILEQKIALPGYSLTNSYAYGDHVKGLTVHPSSSLNPRLANSYSGVWTEEE